MYKKPLNSKFAPAERVSTKVLNQQSKTLGENQILTQLANSLSQMMVVLNKERQIVYANNLFLQLLNINDQNIIIGKRTGEALNCIYSNMEEGGCGTSEFCRTCGAINSILESQTGIKSTKECRILGTDDQAFDLRVTSAPYDLNGEVYTIFTVNDISHEKRRQTLERVFFHDVLNSAAGISGLSSILLEIDDPQEISETAKAINRAANNLISEIKLQHQLSKAEKGDLELKISEINSHSLLKELVELYSNHEINVNRIIQISERSENLLFRSDRVLLNRILGNMIKNAIEASVPGSTVILNCSKINQAVQFSVYNDAFIPQKIQHQLFQRFFSTKGIGRGLGTYSMKLFGEKYLKGKVWFKSTPEHGTTFYLLLGKTENQERK